MDLLLIRFYSAQGNYKVSTILYYGGTYFSNKKPQHRPIIDTKMATKNE